LTQIFLRSIMRGYGHDLIFGSFISDDADTIVDRLRPIAAVAPPLDYAIQILPYPTLVNAPQAPHNGRGEPLTRSALVDHITPEVKEGATERH
jgi:hypothetical protein